MVQRYQFKRVQKVISNLLELNPSGGVSVEEIFSNCARFPDPPTMEDVEGTISYLKNKSVISDHPQGGIIKFGIDPVIHHLNMTEDEEKELEKDIHEAFKEQEQKSAVK
jgi:hypothetical protein